ncbi:MAG: hypothetical protein WB797_13705 [Nocardioides sp.]
MVTVVAGLVARSDDRPSCRLGPDLVPTCGALIGLTAPAPTLADLERSEAAIGVRPGLVYSFHDMNDVIPSEYDKAVVARGQVLHIDIDARDFTGSGESTVSWQAIAAGSYDQQLIAQARGVAGLGVRVFLTFDHEPDQPSRSALGTPTDFVAAWRHVHQVFESNGATNAVWVWVVMGLPQTFASSLTFWPGNDVVDWISWEAYDQAGCRSGTTDPARYRSFADAVLGFYAYLHAHGAAAHIDVHKPMMISEAGTVPLPGLGSPTRSWFDGAPSLLRSHPQIKALTLWDHTGAPGCDFRFAANPAALPAVRTLMDGGVQPSS